MNATLASLLLALSCGAEPPASDKPEGLLAAQKAVALDREALAAAEKANDPKQVVAAHERLAVSLDALARAQKQAGKVEEYLDTLVDLAASETRRGKQDRAEAVLRQQLKATEEKLGADDPAVSKSLNRLANLLFNQERYADAIPLLTRAIAMIEKKGGAEDAEIATLIHNLGVLYRNAGRLNEAVDNLQRALRIREAKLGADHLDTAWTLAELAKTYRFLGQSPRALPLFRKVLQIREAKTGADHLDVADVLNQLALTMMESGQHQDVIPTLERCLKIREAKLPPNHTDIAYVLNNLAIAHWNSGDYYRHKKALELLDRGLKIQEVALGPNHPDVATQLINIAAILDMTWKQIQAKKLFNEEVEEMIAKRKDEREPLFRRALKILETAHGPNHANVAVCLDRLATMLEAEGKAKEAEPLYRRCLQIREKLLPPSHPDVLDSVETLIRLEAVQGHWSEVSDQLDDFNKRMRLHVRTNLPALATPQQLAFLQRTHEPAFHRCLTLPFLRPDDKALIARSAEWVLNGKAVAHGARAEQAALIRESKDPQAPEIARQLLGLRAELAELTRMGPGDTDEAAKKKRLAKLQEQEDALVSRLDLGEKSLKLGDPWVKLDEVRARIPADAMLVEIVDFDLWDFKANDWKSIPRDEELQKTMTDREKALSRYVAWIIPPLGKGDVRFVDLGNSWELGPAIEEYQKAMRGAVRQIQIDEGDAEETMRKHLKAVADRCLAPLEEHLAGTPRWIISPDNHLWMVPWAALPLKDGSYALEKHTISYVASGRDLLPRATKVEPGPALVLGDPDFDLGADAAQREANSVLPKDRLVVRGPSQEATERVPRDWQRLFGTADEIKAVLPKLTAYTKVPPLVYTDARAIESVVKAARSPRVLVLSTHGFSLPTPPTPLPLADGQKIMPGRKIKMRVDGRAPIEMVGDAMARCGLVLAGANKRAKEGDPAADDGILTGVEVLGCDLRGTELVVLSACETGLGDVNLGEGVAGLRQAFQLAGARSVVASLWKVSDQESAKLMASFWDNLAAGQGKAEALRNAQLALIKERRGKEKAAHPFFWAAFTLTGEWK